MNTTRRQVLLAGVRIGTGGSLWLLLGGCGRGEEPLRIDISDVLLQPAKARPIGEEFRRQSPHPVDRHALEAALLARLPGTSASGIELRRGLDRLIREDFAAGRTFLYRSWILSQTEGQLSALALEERVGEPAARQQSPR